MREYVLKTADEAEAHFDTHHLARARYEFDSVERSAQGTYVVWRQEAYGMPATLKMAPPAVERMIKLCSDASANAEAVERRSGNRNPIEVAERGMRRLLPEFITASLALVSNSVARVTEKVQPPSPA